MRKSLLSLLLVAVSATSSFAQQRSETELQNVALETLSTMPRMGKAHRASRKPYTLECVLDKPAFRIYNSQGNGFVIVAKNVSLPAVLGYSEAPINGDNLPCALAEWLSSVDECASAEETNAANTRSAAIEPFVTTYWGQSEPFNLLTPNRFPSGCVATAMAQVINYNRYPESVKFSGSYFMNGDGVLHPESIEQTFAYNYKEGYGVYIPRNSQGQIVHQDYTEEEGTAVGLLLFACGCAVNMNYAPLGSGAFMIDAAAGLIDKFSYPKEAVKYYDRDYYTPEEWDSIISADLSQGVPVIYSGSRRDGSEGHTFVLHGMDDKGYYYVNWGWNGEADGYFALNKLVPTGQDFNFYQSAITGIRPQVYDTDEMHSLFTTDAPYSFIVDKGQLNLVLNSGLFNRSPFVFKGTVAVIAENKATGSQSRLTFDANTSVKPNYGYGAGTMPLFSRLSNNATYTIYLATKDSKENGWTPVRTVGGPITYEMTIDRAGTITVSDAPVYTAIRTPRINEDAAQIVSTEYFNLQGRKLSRLAQGEVVIKRTMLSDGTVRSEKVLLK